MLRLAFLAPDIVESTLDGTNPIEFTAPRLILRDDLPLDWREQRTHFGFIGRRVVPTQSCAEKTG